MLFHRCVNVRTRDTCPPTPPTPAHHLTPTPHRLVHAGAWRLHRDQAFHGLPYLLVHSWVCVLLPTYSNTTATPLRYTTSYGRGTHKRPLHLVGMRTAGLLCPYRRVAGQRRCVNRLTSLLFTGHGTKTRRHCMPRGKVQPTVTCRRIHFNINMPNCNICAHPPWFAYDVAGGCGPKGATLQHHIAFLSSYTIRAGGSNISWCAEGPRG